MFKALIINLLQVIVLNGWCFAQPSSTAVSVAQPIQTQTADFGFAGELEPAQQADVRAAVDGTVKQVLVKDGEMVSEGQLLVQLDDRSLQQQIQSANTEIGKLKAQLEQLDAQVAEAAKKNGDDSAAMITADRDLVAANIQVKEADLERVRNDFEATKITAPLAGRIGGLILKNGDPVYSSPASATRICKITQTSPVRACIDVDQNTLNELQKQRSAARGEKQDSTAADSTSKAGGISIGKITMATGDDQDFKYEGTLDYLGSRVDPQTGQARVCLIFPNPDGALDAVALAANDEDRAVRIHIDLQLARAVFLVADLAVGKDRNGRNFVLTVNDKNQIEFCPVTLGPKHLGMQIIDSGLKPDQWVVIGTPSAKLNPTDTSLSPIDFNNDLRFGNLRTGATVEPVRVPMPRPGKTLRDKTREEVEQQKSK